jgi:hypothetical protein
MLGKDGDVRLRPLPLALSRYAKHQASSPNKCQVSDPIYLIVMTDPNSAVL